MRSKSLFALMALTVCTFGLMGHAEEPGDDQPQRRPEPRQEQDYGDIEGQQDLSQNQQYEEEYQEYNYQEEIQQNRCHRNRRCHRPEVMPYPHCRLTVGPRFVPELGAEVIMWIISIPHSPQPLSTTPYQNVESLRAAVWQLRQTGQCQGPIRNMPFPF